MNEGRATDIVLLLNVEKLFAAAQQVAGYGKLEVAYKCLQYLLIQLKIETRRHGYNA